MNYYKLHVTDEIRLTIVGLLSFQSFLTKVQVEQRFDSLNSF